MSMWIHCYRYLKNKNMKDFLLQDKSRQKEAKYKNYFLPIYDNSSDLYLEAVTVEILWPFWSDITWLNCKLRFGFVRSYSKGNIQ